jgi:hypothetical protein
MRDRSRSGAPAIARRHIQNADCVVGGVGDDGVAKGVVMGCGQKRADVCKDGFADLDVVGCGREVSNGDLTEIGREDECVLTCGRDVVASGLDRGSVAARYGRLAGPGLSIDNASAAAVVRKLEVGLRIISEELDIRRVGSVVHRKDAGRSRHRSNELNCSPCRADRFDLNLARCHLPQSR